MARLTITLSDERHRQLKVRAALRGTTIGALIEEGLESAEERSREQAMAILDEARATAAATMAGMTDDEIEQWAVDEVRAHRRERAGKRR